MNDTPHVNILTYHSIADGPPPLAITPDTFRMQLETLAVLGYRGVSLRACMAAGVQEAACQRLVVLTFDDGYRDFVETALPELEARGFTCTLFLSSGLVGSAVGWDPDGSGRRPIVDWDQAAAVAARGVELGAHGVTHADLTRLGPDEMRHEVIASEVASSWSAYADKLAHRADSMLVQLTDVEFDRGLASLRRHALTASNGPVNELVDFFAFQRS